ncbi:hypothetical protein SADUNF_Sadunf17G0001300 [Salix dunnii]|uniref:Wall-associated receptor kinase galacturonan-binding domain-containing protein n=1 Tax=Salix dunnii TaxID=1413687 RepID=A0A835MEC6_9ROSI|nr:hypothetical protein SADUNF_Sadunf17G0001300 [Salix dunnii]
MFISRVSRHRFGAYAALLLLEILSTHHSCSARKTNNYCAPSCGNFHHISYPFRLNTDPGSCGEQFAELACENNERLTLHLEMVKYYVQAIIYNDSTIRLVDASVQKDDCFSIPHHSLTETELSSSVVVPGVAIKDATSSMDAVHSDWMQLIFMGKHYFIFSRKVDFNLLSRSQPALPLKQWCRISRHPFGAYAALLLLEILSTHHCCSARKTNNDCAPSSCGNILNISYPFRLSNDSESCGHNFFELACENNEGLTFHWNMVKYYVQAINYSDSTILFVDPAVQKDDCFSIPHHSLTEEEFPHLQFYYDNDIYYHLKKNWTESSVLAFICCENEIQNLPDYIKDTSSCKNGSGTAYNSSPSCVNMEGHSYVMVGGLIKDVPDSCRVNLILISTLLTLLFSLEMQPETCFFKVMNITVLYVRAQFYKKDMVSV